MLHLKQLRFKNFLSAGNAFTTINLDADRGTAVTGKNGDGKCLRGSSSFIQVSSPNQELLHDLLVFGHGLREGDETSCALSLDELRAFLADFCKYSIGEITVLTSFGWKRIEAFGITARDSKILCLRFDNGSTVECSPQHRLWSATRGGWVHAVDIAVGERIECRDGGGSSTTAMTRVTTLPFREDLFDIQVAEVSEFYVNGIRSHNSTFVDALTFALYNKAFRKINKNQLVNSINQKGLLVEVDFLAGRHEYTIRRGIKPSLFEIIRDGELVDQSASNVDYQAILEEQILKMNHRTFCQVAVLGTANFVPFMQLSASQRREIVEDLLDIKIFSSMNSVLRDRVASNKEELLTNKMLIAQAEDGIAIHQKHLSRTELERDSRIIALSQQVTNAEDALKAARLALGSLPPKATTDVLTAALSANRDSQLELTFVTKRIADKRAQIKAESNFLAAHDNCPTCHQGIDGDFKTRKGCESDAKLKTLEEAEDRTRTKAAILAAADKKLRAELAALAARNDEYEAARRLVDDESNRLQLLESQLAAEHNAAPQNLAEIESQLNDLRVRLEESKNLRKSLLEQQDYLSFAATLLKDGGIKSRIIRQYIPVINKLINKYLAAMDFFIQFEFDDTFNETIKSKHREDFSFASFSEGEKARINIALLFAWRTLARVRNSAACNLLILDEVFDGSLDSIGTDELGGILDGLAGECNAFIISHREAIIDMFPNMLRFEKRGNFSVLVD